MSFGKALAVREAQKFENKVTNQFPSYMTSMIYQDGLAHMYVHEFDPSIDPEQEAKRVYSLVDGLFRETVDAEHPAEGKLVELINSPRAVRLAERFSKVRSLRDYVDGMLRESYRYRSNQEDRHVTMDETTLAICTTGVERDQEGIWRTVRPVAVEYQPETPGRVIVYAPKLQIAQIQEQLEQDRLVA